MRQFNARSASLFGWCIAGLLVLSACRQEPQEEAAPGPRVTGDTVTFPGAPPASIVTAAVAMEQRVALTLPGRLVWDENHMVKIFTPFAGRVADILAQLGESVSAGQPLAMLTSPDYGVAQSEYRKARTAHALARQALDRERDLFAHGAAAAKEVEQAEAEAATADAEEQRTRRTLDQFGDPGEVIDQRLPLRTPIAGVVVDRAINPGQELRPDQTGSPAFVVADPGSLWLQLDAREGDLPELHPGLSFDFSVAAYPNDIFHGEILRVSDFVDPATRTIKVLGRTANPGRRLKDEMFVTATVSLRHPAQLAVPAPALFLIGEQHYVFVKSESTFVRRKVDVGPESGGRVPVLSGLQSGETVVTQGALYLQQMVQTAGPN